MCRFFYDRYHAVKAAGCEGRYVSIIYLESCGHYYTVIFKHFSALEIFSFSMNDIKMNDNNIMVFVLHHAYEKNEWNELIIDINQQSIILRLLFASLVAFAVVACNLMVNPGFLRYAQYGRFRIVFFLFLTFKGDLAREIVSTFFHWLIPLVLSLFPPKKTVGIIYHLCRSLCILWNRSLGTLYY